MSEGFHSSIGLLRREVRDVRAVAPNIDHRTRKLVDPQALHRPAGWWQGSPPPN